MARQRTNGVEHADRDSESGDIPVTVTDAGVIDEVGNDDAIPTYEPREVIIEPEPTEQRKGKRGRPRGSVNASKSATKEVSQDLSSILFSLHLMGATILKTPELALEEKESEQLGKAVARVNAEFGGMVLDPKTAAVVNLLIVAGGIYVPRVIAVANNRKNAKAEKQAGVIQQ